MTGNTVWPGPRAGVPVRAQVPSWPATTHSVGSPGMADTGSALIPAGRSTLTVIGEASVAAPPTLVTLTTINPDVAGSTTTLPKPEKAPDSDGTSVPASGPPSKATAYAT